MQLRRFIYLHSTFTFVSAISTVLLAAPLMSLAALNTRNLVLLAQLGALFALMLYPFAWIVSAVIWLLFKAVKPGFDRCKPGLSIFGATSAIVVLGSFGTVMASMASDEGFQGGLLSVIMIASGCLVCSVLAPRIFGEELT